MQEVFARTLWLKIGSLAMVSLLLIASVFGVWRTFSTPADTKEQVTLVNYSHVGEFDYEVYLSPSHLYGPPPAEAPVSADEEEAIYFLNITEDIAIDFTYRFVPDNPVTDISSEVDIVAIVTGSRGWQKRVPILSATETDNYFTIPFDLELGEFQEVINTIDEELGFRKGTAGEQTSYNLVIEARVNTVADTGVGRIRDSFVQPMELQVGRDTLTWDSELYQSERTFLGGFSYEQQGSFHYVITLKENSLYQTNTLSSGTYEPAPLISRPPGEVYFTPLVNFMEASFNYEFICDKPVTNLAVEVEVTAILEFPETWSKTFTLVPKAEMSGEFTVDFPVDINYYNELSDTIRREIGRGATSHALTLKAEVHTTANTDAGRIDEVYTHYLTGSLGQNTLTWNANLDKLQTGAITKTNTVNDPDVHLFRALSLIVMVLVLLAFSFVGWNAIRARLSMSWVEQELWQAKKKYKNVIVDVIALPPSKGEGAIILFSSVDELVKTADSLLKPVLHQVIAEQHIYCVIDGLTKYVYVSQ